MKAPRSVTRRGLLLALGALPLVSLAKNEPKTFVEVWKDPGCGCCKDWIKHLEADGFAVKMNETSNPAAIRAKLGIPQQMGSCHTALVNGYAIEGHVPAEDIRRLLREKPHAVGLAAPGMPVGAPGMDGPAYQGRRDPYQVLLVLRNGDSRLFAMHNKAG